MRAVAKTTTMGAVLILVLWAVVILSIITLNFSFMVRVHLRITSNYAVDSKLSNIASAGVDLAISQLRIDPDPIDHLGEEWCNCERIYSEVVVGEGKFSLEKYSEYGTEENVFGLEDEASKINLIVTPEDTLKRLEGMTDELAEAIGAWQTSQISSSTDTTEPTTPDAAPANSAASLPSKGAKMDSLYELLLLPGFDASALLGEDWNNNGVLDPNEDDGDTTSPPDNKDGVLDRGLLPYVTLYSSDWEVSQDGSDRVNVNSANKQELLSTIPGLSDIEADSIISHVTGSKLNSVAALLTVPKLEEKKDKKGKKEKNKRKKKSSSSTGKSRIANSKFAKSSDNKNKNKKEEGNKPKEPEMIFNLERLKQIIDYCKVTDEEKSPGRVNINTAAQRIFEVHPKINEALAKDIIAYREKQKDGFRTIADIMDVPGMTQELFMELAQYITVRSFQYRVKSVAEIEGIEKKKTIIAVLDKAGDRIEILYWNER
jgi:DNA uptake protein ComE-like DNA-binding protein